MRQRTIHRSRSTWERIRSRVRTKSEHAHQFTDDQRVSYLITCLNTLVTLCVTLPVALRSGCHATISAPASALADEDLIKYAWPNDVWFHVDKLSSAHVYLRMPDNIPAWDAIPEPLLQDCSQLVKANSIEGALHPRIRTHPMRSFVSVCDLRSDSACA
jgi:hypothetical protein